MRIFEMRNLTKTSRETMYALQMIAHPTQKREKEVTKDLMVQSDYLTESRKIIGGFHDPRGQDPKFESLMKCEEWNYKSGGIWGPLEQLRGTSPN